MSHSTSPFDVSSLVMAQTSGTILLIIACLISRSPLEMFAVCFSSIHLKESVREMMTGFILVFSAVLLLFPIRHVLSLSADQIFNLFEGYLWIGIAISLYITRRNYPIFKAENRIATISFFLFGVSDFIEMHTGAWYQPWQLFFLKTACIVGFILSLTRYVAAKRRLQNKNT